jgi:hypothetical protein
MKVLEMTEIQADGLSFIPFIILSAGQLDFIRRVTQIYLLCFQQEGCRHSGAI